jgi:hypothetical protein
MAPAAREPGQKGVNYTNLLVGSVMNIAEVTTLGQPFEVLKTQMAANRSQRLPEAARTVWSRGGVFGFYQGLIPWVRRSLPPPQGCLRVASTPDSRRPSPSQRRRS